MQPGKLLSVDDLHVEIATSKGTLLGVAGVSFDIAAGEVLGIVGESGAGKSLTCTAILGLLDPPLRQAGGKIHLDGRRIDNLPPHSRHRLRGREIGAIFQNPLSCLDPLQTVGRQLAETIRTHRRLDRAACRSRALELLAEVGIGAAAERLGQYPHELSGGMRQRVVIALALAGNPRLLIADEPTTALDVSVRSQIIALLKRLCRVRGIAILLITHDLGVIVQAADRMAIMYAGRIVEIGPVPDILRRPNHPYTQGLLQAIPRISGPRGALRPIPGAMPGPGGLPTGCAFNPRCGRRVDRCLRETPPLIRAAGSDSACWLAPEPENV